MSLDDRRAFRLTAACFRRHWDRLQEASRDFTRLAEVAAEGMATRQDLDDAFDALEEAMPAGSEFRALLDLAYGTWQSDQWPVLAESDVGEDATWRPERRAQAESVRRVFGNPFRATEGRDQAAEPDATADGGRDPGSS